MKYKSYPKYKFVKAGFFDQIPEEWNMGKLKNLVKLAYGDSLKSEIRENGEFDVYGSNGVVGSHSECNTKSPCLIVGRKGSFGKVNFSEKPVFAIDTTYFIDKRYTNQDIKWLYYLLVSLKLDSFSKDSAVPGLSREDAYFYDVPICSFEEQLSIAAFLDRETARIDALIEKKKKLIELLKEKRTALITRAVTKGLNQEVKMKPSGIEWLGEIPEHWEVKRLKGLSQIITSNVDKKSYDDEIQVLLCNYTDVYNNEIIDINSDFMIATANREEIRNQFKTWRCNYYKRFGILERYCCSSICTRKQRKFTVWLSFGNN